MKGRDSISLYAFNVQGTRGIDCSLQNLHKIKDGEPLGATKSKAYDDFDDEDDDDGLPQLIVPMEIRMEGQPDTALLFVSARGDKWKIK